MQITYSVEMDLYLCKNTFMIPKMHLYATLVSCIMSLVSNKVTAVTSTLRANSTTVPEFTPVFITYSFHPSPPHTSI